MSQRNKYDWPALFQEFNNSNTTQAQFCAERGINAKYFSLCYAKHQRKLQNNFSRVKVEPLSNRQSNVVLKLSHGELHFGSSTDPAYIASLIRAL